MSAISDHAAIRAAAQQWFARLLAPDCSDVERAAFDRWRGADPAHDVAFREVERVWESSAGLQEDPAIAAALQEAMRPAARPREPRRRRWWPVLAAAASVVLVVAALLWAFAPERVQAVRYATVPGEQRTVALDDGSKVVLDTDTALLVRFGKRERNLTLQHGRADFKVQHDAGRPFIVHAGSGSVTATGTHFQVGIKGDGSTVTLLKGQVLVAGTARSRTVTLEPGQRIVIGPSGEMGALQIASESELASARGWTDGNLVVKGWPLRTVVAEMNRYSNVKLRLGDPELGGLPISGVFKVGDQKSFALALKYGWSIHVDRRPAADEIVLTGHDSQPAPSHAGGGSARR